MHLKIIPLVAELKVDCRWASRKVGRIIRRSPRWGMAVPCHRMMAAGVVKRGYILKVTTAGFADDLDVLYERNRRGKGQLKGLARAP